VIVCHCNALREREVRAAVDPDCRRVSRLYDRLGCRPRCKQCLPFAFGLIGEEQRRALPAE
jgi:bacterioferritin-associated ferredoxin